MLCCCSSPCCRGSRGHGDRFSGQFEKSGLRYVLFSPKLTRTKLMMRKGRSSRCVRHYPRARREVHGTGERTPPTTLHTLSGRGIQAAGIFSSRCTMAKHCIVEVVRSRSSGTPTRAHTLKHAHRQGNTHPTKRRETTQICQANLLKFKFSYPV